MAEFERSLPRKSRKIAAGIGFLILGTAIGAIGLNFFLNSGLDGSMRCAVEACEPVPPTISWWFFEMLAGLTLFGLGLSLVFVHLIDASLAAASVSTRP